MSLSNRSGVIAAAAILLIAAAPLSADESGGMSWDVGPLVGMQWGQCNEIVYDTSGVSNINDYLSLLTWENDNVFTAGAFVDWNTGRKISLRLELNSAVPGQWTGEMNDYDWLYTDMDWSHWSVSDIQLRWGFDISVSGDWSFLETGPYSMGIGCGYHLDWWAWTDITRDSLYSTTVGSDYPVPFGDYGGDGFRDLPDEVPVGVNGIDYEVAYHVLFASLGASLDWQVFYIDLTGMIGPVFALSHDYHKLRDLHFYDRAFGGPWLAAELNLGFRTRGRFRTELSGNCTWMAETRGNTIINDAGISYKVEDSAGFSYREFGLALSCYWTLGKRSRPPAP